MNTLTRPPGTDTDPLPETTPYFLRCAIVREAAAAEAARRAALAV